MATINGTTGSDHLLGTTDDDVINCYAGMDGVLAGNGNDVILCGDDDDSPIGELGNDTIYGGAGNDFIEFYDPRGNDLLIGGLGNDRYLVDSALDVVVEAANEGWDSIVSLVNYRLPENVEGLSLDIAHGAFAGWGNALANIINGNYSDNSLYGGDGDDLIHGDAGDDRLIGGFGNDTITGDHYENWAEYAGPSGSDSLFGGDGNDVMYGADLDDSLVGGNGNDLLNGDDVVDEVYTYYNLPGDDTLNGCAGNDTIFAYDGNDILKGGADNDVLHGDGGNDNLHGGGGQDTLHGDDGNDTLTGGGNSDRFVFDAMPGIGNVDTLTDFASGKDFIVLDNAMYEALAEGALAAIAFRSGSVALDADDRILFDISDGSLYYDADGSGSGVALLFASLSTGTLVAADILVI